MQWIMGEKDAVVIDVQQSGVDAGCDTFIERSVR